MQNNSFALSAWNDKSRMDWRGGDISSHVFTVASLPRSGTARLRLHDHDPAATPCRAAALISRTVPRGEVRLV
ncbi:hypothetical protein GCM10022419_023190 [Nonomuraea rosea]|uniref:Uncharacterized protein n=1 Tax=Nonomuraea rosea TaxID=638574 RepID=A0ABP6W1S9_9ACTN